MNVLSFPPFGQVARLGRFQLGNLKQPILLSGNPYLAVIVAMPAMWMVEVSFDKVIDMIAVGHGFMSTLGAMHVPLRMPAALMLGSAVLWIGG